MVPLPAIWTLHYLYVDVHGARPYVRSITVGLHFYITGNDGCNTSNNINNSLLLHRSS